MNHVIWWKTYSPPIWLLNGQKENVQTTDLMGMKSDDVKERLLKAVACTWKKPAEGVVLVAPSSATFLDQFSKFNSTEDLILKERWRYNNHINLDDLDFETEGVVGTLSRVVGRRGLVVWDVTRKC
jgi:phosphatidylinositol glycan class Z